MSTQPPATGAFQGRHVLGEIYGVDPGLLNDEERLCALLREALTEAKATVLDVRSHHFAPQGVTVMALLAESHASCHTYPEYGCAYVDFFTCGTAADPAEALHNLSKALRPTRYHVVVLDRGVPALPIPLTASGKAHP
ncbi:adenosylmethionine decarboxylase [Nonomuraea aridisoli]|uniref:adenosylmethionine decarboxylase n=1 Tax=Nonomuraea aridisoli TaxID=2070368 RepID=UPI001C64DCFB|nr:adenosylmethionine decarboxylase [Nonomuraea aridisoli]